MLHLVHDTPSSGHPGITASLQLLSDRFWWPTLQADTVTFVQQCPVCNMSKSSHQRPAVLLQPLPVSQRPWSHIAIDFVTDLPNSRNYTTILTVIDRFSKACRLIPLPKLPTAFETAKALLELAKALLEQNSLRKPSTGLTPFQCVLGFQPPLFPWSGEPSELTAVNDWLMRSEETWNAAHVHLQRAVRRTREQADLRRREGTEYTPGQWVWLSSRDLRLRPPCKKLSPRYVGPFQISRQITSVSYRLALPAEYC